MILKKLFFIIPTILIYSCAYYNTFFNAETNFREGIEKLENSADQKITPSIRQSFDAAISKSWRVISVYGDSNSWADDALLLIGKSHYYLQEYEKSKEIFENFLQKFLKSELIPEAELWLARSFLQLSSPEQAIENLTAIIGKTEDSSIKASAYFYLGDIYFDQQNYEQAIENYSNCLNYSSSEDISGNAQYKLADSYFNLKKYDQASEEYKAVLYYDMATLKQFNAVLQIANSLMQLDKHVEAEEVLKNVLTDQRFKKQYSLIAAKLANLFEFQGDIDYAIEKYKEVIQQYPKTEGSALASFYLAQIYEFEYGWLDSAKVRYDEVSKQFSKSEASEESKERSKILSSYVNIKTSLLNDKEAIYRLEHGDSLIVDSLVTGQDTIMVSENVDSDADTVAADNDQTTDDITNQQQSENDLDEATSDQQEITDRFATMNHNSTENQTQLIKDKKVAVVRDPEEIRESLKRNSYALAEYFLLTYEHYDSAQIAYRNFLANFMDSLLTPKAYYSLFYIYNQIKSDSVRADSIKKIILNDYPNTIYSKKLTGNIGAPNTDDKIKDRYLVAEEAFSDNNYQKAINLFYDIANSDSGSTWAIKSLYATGYIYENYLNDKLNAIKVYQELAKQYPLTDQGKIALNKVKEPPKDEPPPVVEDQASTDSLKTQTPEPEKKLKDKVKIEEKTPDKIEIPPENKEVDKSGVKPDEPVRTPDDIEVPLKNKEIEENDIKLQEQPARKADDVKIPLQEKETEENGEDN